MKLSRYEKVGSGLWEVALITVLALAFRLIHLEEMRQTDSYFHIMGAASLLHDGTLLIGGDVPYDRAYLFTYLVAGFQSLFGGTTWVAGLPAILAGVATVAVVFLWVRSVAGRTAAWIAGLLFCFDMGSLVLAHMVRFYTLHTLLFFLGAIGLYYLVVRRPSWGSAALISVIVIASLSLAYHLQITTVIGGIALVSWLLIEAFPRVVCRLQNNSRSTAIAVAFGAAILILAAAAVAVQYDLASRYWRLLHGAPMWAQWKSDTLTYYYAHLGRSYGALWVLFPVAAVFAIAKHGRPAVFAVVMFTVPFILHSVAAFKAERFLSYAMPFFFVTWGIAIAAALPGIKGVVRDAVINIIGFRPADRVLAVSVWGLLIAMIIVLGLMNRPIWWKAYTFVVGTERPEFIDPPRWDKAARVLNAVIDSVEVVVVSTGEGYYYLDHVHVIAHAGHVAGGVEFEPGHHLGVPGISERTSLETLFRCYNSGLVAIDGVRWGKNWAFTEEMIEGLQARAQPFALPAEWRIHAYTWSHSKDVGEEVGCPVLDERRAPRL
jgi:hypothetical protein